MSSKKSISEKKLGLKENLSFIGKLLRSREYKEQTNVGLEVFYLLGYNAM
jgi:hypothetical protein